MLRFGWDERKNKANRKKNTAFGLKRHGPSSTIRVHYFLAIRTHSEEEERFILLGASSAGRTLVVIHCYKESEELFRIISARKASKKEVKAYEEGI